MVTYVLPNVNTDDRKVGFKKKSVSGGDHSMRGNEEITKELTRTEQRILVRRRYNLELPRLGVIAEPSPTTTLYASCSRIELLLECLYRAKVALESGLQLAIFELATALLYRCEVLPEQGVVDVAFMDM
jgi:hypothetical protein